MVEKSHRLVAEPEAEKERVYLVEFGRNTKLICVRFCVS